MNSEMLNRRDNKTVKIDQKMEDLLRMIKNQNLKNLITKSKQPKEKQK